MTGLVIVHEARPPLALPFFALFKLVPIKDVSIICPMISTKLNNTFVQTSQDVVLDRLIFHKIIIKQDMWGKK